MIEFFRDFLDGPIYFVVVGISIILIMAIIGYLMEKKKIEQEEKNKRVTIDIAPINPVEVQEQVLTNDNIETSVQMVPNSVASQSKQVSNDDIIQTVNLTPNQEEVEETIDSKLQPAIQVIDFGSTSNVDVDH